MGIRSQNFIVTIIKPVSFHTMLVSSIVNVLIAIAPAFATLSREQKESYEGFTEWGFPYPYICEDLTSKLTEPFAQLSDDKKKEWVKTFYKIADTVIYLKRDENSKYRADYAACLGFRGKKEVAELYEAYKKLLNFSEKQSLIEQRLTNGKAAGDALDDWRKKNGLGELEPLED